MGHVCGRAEGSTVAGWVRLVRCSARVAGRRIVVADAATEEKADLLDDFVSIIYSFAARLYGLRSADTGPMT